MSKIPFFKIFTNSKFSVSNENKYYVGVKPQPTLSCVGRIEKRLIKNSLCHPELVSGSCYRQKCSAICTQKSISGKEVLDKVCWAESPTLKYCWGRNPNLQKAISYASRKAQRHVRGDLVPAFTLAEVLITLGIIGVVAAMTLPQLIQSYRKQQTEVKLAKFYSVINQALKQSIAQNGDIVTPSFSTNENSEFLQEWCQTNITKYLQSLKKLKFNQNYYHIEFADGSNVRIYGGDNSVIYFFYCTDYYRLSDKCFQFSEQYGGIHNFTFTYDSTHKEIRPIFYYFTHSQKLNSCASSDRFGCAALIYENGWKVPKDYPLKF